VRRMSNAHNKRTPMSREPYIVRRK
jgi:hypothetical protein